MGAHDSRYRLLFSHPLLIGDLLRGFVREEWVEGLDLSSLERVNGSFVRPDQRQRHGDMVWRARLPKAAGEEEEWVYVYVLLEFQSNPERFMAVRVLGYIVGLLEDLIRRKELAPGGLLPPVTAVVCYRGQVPWTSPQRLRSLFAAVPAGLRRHLPELSFRLLDARRMTREELEVPSNLASSLFRIEAVKAMEDLQSILAQLASTLPPGKEPELRRALIDFLKQVLQEAFPGVIIPESSDLEDFSMLEHNMQLWRKREEKKHREEGLKEGRKEGRQEARLETLQKTLLVILRERFGRLPQSVSRRVKSTSSADELTSLVRKAATAENLSDLGLS